MTIHFTTRDLAVLLDAAHRHDPAVGVRIELLELLEDLVIEYRTRDGRLLRQVSALRLLELGAAA